MLRFQTWSICSLNDPAKVSRVTGTGLHSCGYVARSSMTASRGRNIAPMILFLPKDRNDGCGYAQEHREDNRTNAAP